MYYSLCVTLPIERLTAAIALIDTVQAQAKTKEMADSDIMNLRLAPDMFPFSKQIQVMTDIAKGTASRLWAKEAPKYEDTESTLDELKVRLEKTIAFLQTFSPDGFIWAESREARFPYFPGMHMVGEKYLIGYALPNFLFHATTAYNILRNHGFELGKKDYIHALPLLPDIA